MGGCQQKKRLESWRNAHFIGKILQKSLSMAREARKPANTWLRTACLCSLLCLVPEGVARCGRAFSRPHAPGHLPLSAAPRWTAGQGVNVGWFRRQESREAVPEGVPAQASGALMLLAHAALAQPEGMQAAQDRGCQTASAMPMRAGGIPRASQVAKTPCQSRSRPGGRAEAPQRPRQNDASHGAVKGPERQLTGR